MLKLVEIAEPDTVLTTVDGIQYSLKDNFSGKMKVFKASMFSRYDVVEHKTKGGTDVPVKKGKRAGASF